MTGVGVVGSPGGPPVKDAKRGRRPGLDGGQGEADNPEAVRTNDLGA